MPPKKAKVPAVSPINLNLETYFQSDEIFKNAFHYSAIGMALVSLEGKWLKVNPKVCDIVGYPEEELLQLTFQDITHPDDLDLDLNKVKQLAEGKIDTYTMEKRYIHKNGSIVWVLLSVSLARDENKKPLFFISQIEDITERKLSNEQLIESEKRYRNFFDNSPIPLWEEDFSEVKKRLDVLKAQGVTDFDAYFASHPDVVRELASSIRILDINKAALKLFGANSVKELVESSQETSLGEIENNHRDFIAIAEGKTTNQWNGTDITLSGEAIEISLSWSVVSGHEHDYSRVIVTTFDITEQKQAQREVENSKERYQSLFEDSPISLWEEDFSVVKQKLDELKNKGVTDIKEYILMHPEFLDECASSVRILGVNDASVKLFNANNKEELTTNLHKLLVDAPVHQFEYELINIANGVARFEWEEINKKLSGELIHVRLTWHASPGYEESLAKVIVAIVDVTESKLFEQELQKSEDNYKNIIENMPAILYLDQANENSTSFYISPQIEQLLGYTPSAYIENPNLWHKQIESQDYQIAINSIQETLEKGEGTQEYRMIAKDGQLVWVRDSSVLIRDKQGNPKFIQGFIQDISEEKIAKDKLKASEERYKSIIEDMPMMLCRFKPDGTLTFINAYYCQYFKKDYAELLGSNLFDLVSTEEHDIVKQKYLSLNHENPFITYEYKTVDLGGRVNWQRWTDRALFNEKGEIVEYQSIGEDITEQKIVEEKIRKSEEYYRRLTENFPNGIVIVCDRDFRFMLLSGGEIERYNVNPQKYLGKTFQEVLHPEILEKLKPYMNAALNGEKDTFELPYLYNSYYLVNFAPLQEADGSIKEILIIAQNITEQKQANEIREESERRYRSLFEDSPISLWEEDFSGVKKKLDELKQAGIKDFEAYFSSHPQVVMECASLVKILNVNKASVELYNAKSKEDLTTNMLKLLRADSVTKQFTEELIKIANGETHFEREELDSSLSGKPLVVSIVWSVMPGHEEDLSRVIVSIVDITERKQIEEERRRLIEELGERLKELTFLHNISRIFMDDSRTEFEILQAVADAIPSAWQYPKITAARVGYNGYQFTTSNFRQTDWMLSQFFELPNGLLGIVQVAYLEERPQADNGPFVTGEVQLLESTVEKLRTYIKGILADQAMTRQLAELETLYESGLKISQLLTPKEIAQEVIGVLARKMNWHHIAIREYDQDSNSVKLIGFNKPGISVDEAEEYIQKMNSVISNPTQGLSGWVTTYGKSLRVPNVNVDKRFVRTFPDINSGLYVPLKVGELVIGSISVESEIENGFSENDERLLVTLAGQASIAIENANLFNDLEKRVQERTVQIEATKRRLELATHAGQIGVWEYIPRENKAIWDERMHQIHHVAVGKFDGTTESWAKYIHPEDLAKSQMNSQLAFTENLLINNEHRIIWQDGSIHYLATSAVTVFAEDNTPERVIGISRDITERKQIEQNLEDSEAYARLLFDAAPDPVFVTEFNGRMVDANQFFEIQHQIKREDLKGKHISELGIFPPAELEKANQYMREVATGNNIPSVELKFNTPYNSLHTLELHSYSIESNGVQLILSTSRDITAHKKLEEALKLANAEMENALKVKDEFLANMSHELRTPLNAILGISESLEEQIIGQLNDKQLKYIGVIKESGKHLLELINDILDISKIEAGRMELTFHPISVEKLCQASLRMIKELAQKKNVQVSFKIQGEVNTIMGDERRLKQVLVNLLSNAVKFTEEGKQVGLEVVGYPENNEVTFSVWDTGIGIAQEDLKFLFKPFVQLDAGLAREYQGTGLGLALVAQMIRLHGGLVGATSEQNKGSTFTVTLPWQPEEQNTPVKVTGELVLPNQKSEEKRKGRILLVEDTDVIIALIKDYLTFKGYEVIVANNGREGILLAKEKQPDIILMDVMMPIMDGVEATKQIRAEKNLRQPPIIALTALAMHGDRDRCLEAGMTDYMSKPVNLNELIDMIEKHIAQG